MYGSGHIILIIVFITVVFIGLFFICREIICWYYKINTRLDQQRQTNVLLEKLYKELTIQNGSEKGGQAR